MKRVHLLHPMKLKLKTTFRNGKGKTQMLLNSDNLRILMVFKNKSTIFVFLNMANNQGKSHIWCNFLNELMTKEL